MAAGANPDLRTGATADRFVWQGVIGVVGHKVSLWLHPRQPLWLWRVEIVNDGARREQSLKAAGKRSQLDPGEREIYLRAWQLLAREIARSRGVDAGTADEWIELQLAVA